MATSNINNELKEYAPHCFEKQCYLVLTYFCGKRMYQPSLEINASIAFTNNMKGLHLFTINRGLEVFNNIISFFLNSKDFSLHKKVFSFQSV